MLIVGGVRAAECHVLKVTPTDWFAAGTRLKICVSDQDDVVSLPREATRLGMDLRNQRTGRVDGRELPALGLSADLRCNAVSREDENLPRG